MNRLSSWCFSAAFALLAWAAHAVVFNPPMLLTGGSSSAVIDLGTATGSSSVSPATVTVGAGGVPAGSTIVALVAAANGVSGGTSVTDTQSNTYVQQARALIDSSNLYSAMWVCQNCAALTAGNIISFHVGSGTSIISVLAIKTTQAVSLNLNTTPVTSGGSKNTTPSITSGVASTAGEIFVGGVSFVAVSPTTSMIQATGWATPPDFSTTIGSMAVGGGWLKNAGTSAQTYAPTLSAANFWGAMLLSFKL